ncbi:hypothetical protein BCU68_15745 [Vibrio sp. 10N.286.49.B3]|uniref:protein-glutamate methylesterase/protein-glutamine glutaminase n=1 Tax=Vibrio sp. 10N.286.49.B3 TaxID=1880855 RepID=UPI000C858C3A|nr:chemotaxis response regulator protein-glutamate methylesterase [Vibrio sp. 10N.286.49.B3]PMH41407.1 hypothetical protein BCU68_15745 [Vibrio sp. 10N.286.49.B3]
MQLKVLVTDSSLTVCESIEKVISSQSNMSVVGIAHSPFQARQMIKDLNPDVLTLSIEFSHMNGLDFLDKIMSLRPMPVVIISKLAQRGSLISQQALKIGATACVTKPKNMNIELIARDIIKSIRDASYVFERNITVAKQLSQVKKVDLSHYLIAIGASTGGTEAITHLLTQMPVNCPGIVIAQHMPKGFTASFAERLQSLCAINVSEAKHDTPIQSGHAYIAPGGLHLQVQKRSGAYYTMLSDSDPVNLHKPSIDILFESVADNIKKLSIGIILTGMGKDGALGLLKMKQAGAKTLSQNEATSLVYGMPREAVKVGAVTHELALDDIVASALSGIKTK